MSKSVLVFFLKKAQLPCVTPQQSLLKVMAEITPSTVHRLWSPFLHLLPPWRDVPWSFLILLL